MSDYTVINDYSYEPPSSGGKYLRLKEKGQKIRIRIAGAVIKFQKEFTDKDTGAKEVKDSFAWPVIDKTEKDFAGKGFEGGLMIYLGVKKLALSEEWGDPTKYDLIIERTEKQGQYYTVTPVPKGMGDIPEEQFALLDDIDIIEMFTKQRAASDAPAPAGQRPNNPPSEDEYDPFADD